MYINRRDFLKTTGLGLTALSMPGCLAPRAGSRSRPNIIFIMADDHAARALSCYGGGLNRTPSLDRIAEEGMRFDNCFCTNSICAPSRASILTGKYSHLNGVKDNRSRFDGSQVTFPKLLQAAGYQTAMIGKWHLKTDPTGFDYWSILPGQGAYYNPDFIEMGEKKRHQGYVTDITTDFCLEWLDRRDKSRPFLLMFHHKAPHRNWMPGPDHLTQYDGTDIPEPSNLFDDYATRSDAARLQEMTIANHMFPAYDLKLPPAPADSTDQKYWKPRYERMTEAQRARWDAAYGPRNRAYLAAKPEGDELTRYKYQRYMKDYLRCIASIDDNVGRLLDYLEAQGLAEDTIVVYTSDQGFYLGEHGWFDKRFMYEESLRMPLLVRYPRGIKPGSVSEEMVLNIDFAPTFLRYAGVEVPEAMQGRSMKDILSGRVPANWRQSMYYHYYEYPAWHMVRPHYGVRTDRYKLIHFYGELEAWELYDLKTDPREMQNVYGHSEYATVELEMKAELARSRKLYKDEGAGSQ